MSGERCGNLPRNESVSRQNMASPFPSAAILTRLFPSFFFSFFFFCSRLVRLHSKENYSSYEHQFFNLPSSKLLSTPIPFCGPPPLPPFLNKPRPPGVFRNKKPPLAPENLTYSSVSRARPLFDSFAPPRVLRVASLLLASWRRRRVIFFRGYLILLHLFSSVF